MTRFGGFGSAARALAIVPLLVAGLALASARPAAAATYNCVGYIEAGTTIKGNLIVPVNEDCYPEADVTITGNVTVRQGATFEPAGDRVEIRGNLSASRANYVELDYTTVRGSVSISSTDYVDIVDSDIRGNVTISQSGTVGNNPEAFGYVDIRYSTFRASVVLSKNDFDGYSFSDNDVKINLVCDENVNADIYGNRVDGQVIGDCPGAESGGDL